ncbi:MAG: 50S ribosomal protein L11 methyltransferase [Clostridia bacterium]|nr:50S ribosomal protein L11 methyltransferase [Clostridia bacterium]
MENWTEIKIIVPAAHTDVTGDIANMCVPYGIYTEDYRDLEQAALDIAHIDLIDEELLQKDRTKSIIHIYISPDDNPAEAAAFLEERLHAEHIPFAIEFALRDREEWENNWKKYFKPVKIGQKLLIRPVWEEIADAEKENRVVLDLEPGIAFGSGTHETTRLCLSVLEKYITPGCDMLDVGCGSGILSVAALLLGANHATGVDIDSLAVKTAAENGARNGFGADKYTLIHGDLTDKVSGAFDVIAANIVADAIIALSGGIKQFMRENSVYIISGIIDKRESDVLAAVNALGFTVKERHEQNGWLCFVLEL